MNVLRSTFMLVVVLFHLCASRAFGLAGDLDRPSLSFPTGFESAQAMLSVISDKQFAFKGGKFINAGSTLDYAGNADSLNGFLSRLAACKGAKVSVSFSENDADWSWRLQHHAWTDPAAFHIVVNTRHIVEANVKVPKAETPR